MVEFRAYAASDRERCLEIFDANAPRFFAPNEREEYACFLDSSPDGYEACVMDGGVVGAFGVIGTDDADPPASRLQWILLDPGAQGRGIGRAVMGRVVDSARTVFGSREGHVAIAASHLSAPFFARFGAIEVTRTDDGWGPGMHRVDMRMPV